MSIKLSAHGGYGYNSERNKYKIPILYLLYVKMPNTTEMNRMNKRSQLSDLTRLAIRILEHGNNKYRPPSLMQLKPQNKINTIKKAINKVMVKNRTKAATTIQHYFKTKREMNTFANTNRGSTVKNQIPTITGLISAFRRKERGN
jgi:hypothetical protein